MPGITVPAASPIGRPGAWRKISSPREESSSHGGLRSEMEHFCLTAHSPARSYAARKVTSRSDVFAPMAGSRSRTIVDLVRAWCAHYNLGDGKPSLAYWHEDAEYHTAPHDPDSAVHRGIDAISRLFASWREAYPDLRVEVHETKANKNRVFAWIRFVGRGAASGIPLHMELAQVYTVRNGRTASVVEYVARTDALKAVGLAGVGDVAGERGRASDP